MTAAVPEPRPFTWEDVRQGDRIRVAYANGDVTVTREGVAALFADGTWSTPSGRELGNPAWKQEVALVSRPYTDGTIAAALLPEHGRLVRLTYESITGRWLTDEGDTLPDGTNIAALLIAHEPNGTVQ